MKMSDVALLSFNVKKEIADAFSSLGYISLSDVQAKTIPLLLKKESVLANSYTGSGKTFCYLIPIINNIDFSSDSIEAIIIVPTNILVDQVKKEFDSFFDLLGYSNEFIKVIKSKNDFSRVKAKVVITTPSMYKEVFSHYSTNRLSYVIIDEADMLLFDGFLFFTEDVKKQIDQSIISVFSASIKTQDITRIKRRFKIKNVVSISQKINCDKISHHLIDFSSYLKKEALNKIISSIKYMKMIVFFKSVEEANDVYLDYKDRKDVFIFHGELDKREIKKTFSSLQKKDSFIVFSSDYLSRGVDLKGIDTIISYSLPDTLDYYFHRAGRTGRFFTDGDSYIMVDKDNEKEIKDILSLKRREVSFDVFKVNETGLKKISQSYVFKNLGKKDQSNEQLQKKIRHAYNKNKSDKVKPNYKKKVSKAIKRVKEKHRMKVVRTNIAKKGGNARDFHQD